MSGIDFNLFGPVKKLGLSFHFVVKIGDLNKIKLKKIN